MRKRIAFITVNADTLYQMGLIEVMSRQSALLGYDLIVLTHFINYDNDTEHLRGDENIYSLIKQLSFDGAVIDLGSFYSRNLTEKLQSMLLEKGVPVISLDCRSELFESCIQNNRDSFKALTEHFIKVHGFRKIYCLSGLKGVVHSEERVKGYVDALRANNIPARRSYIFYGDFWINYAKDFARHIAQGEIEKPEAVVCGNDFMALQLCLSLAENGINVPDDIAVGGYDGNPDVNNYHPVLTTFCNAFRENGAAAVCRLHELISGTKADKWLNIPTYVKTGASCGCKNDTASDARVSSKMFDTDMNVGIFMHSSYSSMMNNVKDLEECAVAVTHNVYLLKGENDFFICLCTDENGAVTYSVKEGYTDNMVCIMTHCRRGNDVTRKSFPLDLIIPEEELSDEPVTYICTPLHYLDRSFGYCARRYTGSNIIFEKYYGEFCQVTANTIERIRMLDYENYLKEKIQRLSERDILTGLFSRKGLISRTDKLSSEQRYFGVLYYIEGAEQLREEHGNEYIQQMIVTFAQAVNLSCARGELSARTGSEEFMIIGSCDDFDFPEQLFINSLKANLKMAELQQGANISAMLSHFSEISPPMSCPTELIYSLEKKLELRKSSAADSGSAFLSKLRELQNSVYEEPQLQWNAETEAARIGVSISYFQHLYRKNLGTSFNADVISARLALAERLLAGTALNVSEIAEKCGYPDASHFMKLFRKKTGRTAMEYRRAMSEKRQDIR